MNDEAQMTITAQEWLNIYRGWAMMYRDSDPWLCAFIAQWKFSDLGAEYIPIRERKREQLATD